MKTKLVNFRFSQEAHDALVEETARTGKTMTKAIEDILLWRRVFNDDAEDALQILQRKTKLERRRVIEAALIKAAGRGGQVPFECLDAARRIGSILPLPHSSRRRWCRSLADRIGMKSWPQDVTRHTAATYWLAVEPDAARIALQLGNSPAILIRHYRALVTRTEAEKFWLVTSEAADGCDQDRK